MDDSYKILKHLLCRDTVHVVTQLRPAIFFHQAVYVGFKTGKLLVEITREFQEAHDGRVEAFAWNQ